MEPVDYIYAYHTYLKICYKRNRTFVPDRETETVHATKRTRKCRGRGIDPVAFNICVYYANLNIYY